MTNRNRIALTGGSGHLGTALIIRLLELGYILKSQFNTFTPPITHANLEWVQCDINDSKAINNLITDCDVVIHCASLISVGHIGFEDIYSVNVIGTENVLMACENHPNIKLIHISSSTAVQEHSSNGIFTETQPYKTNSDFSYPYTKALAEQLVLDSVKTKNLDAIIMRPSSIVGPPDYKHSLMGQTIWDFSQKKYPLLTTGGYNLVDIRDLTDTIINSFKLGIKGNVYLLSGIYVDIKDLAKMANSAYSPFLLPLNLVILLLPIIELYRKIFGLNLPITKESLLTLKHAPKNMDCAKAKRDLQHNPRPIHQTIDDLVDWFKTPLEK